jgi:hypothetical protein
MVFPNAGSSLLLIAVFVAGLAAGWLLATFRPRARLSLQPTGTGTSSLAAKRARILELKCGCGSVWKFRDSTGALPPGYEPYPKGDSYTCPNCGRSIDLKAIQKLEADRKV